MLGDGVEYDVNSFLLDGSHHHIEVKATCGGIMVPFFLSASELRHALEHPGAYSIYRVFDLGLLRSSPAGSTIPRPNEPPPKRACVIRRPDADA